LPAVVLLNSIGDNEIFFISLKGILFEWDNNKGKFTGVKD